MKDFYVEPYSGRTKKRDTSKDQIGGVLVFKKGVSQAEARLALKQIQHLLAHPPTVEPFNPEYGEPVFYIP